MQSKIICLSRKWINLVAGDQFLCNLLETNESGSIKHDKNVNLPETSPSNIKTG